MAIDVKGMMSLDGVLSGLGTVGRTMVAGVFRNSAGNQLILGQIATAMFNEENLGGEGDWERLPPAERTVWFRRAKAAMLKISEIVAGK